MESKQHWKQELRGVSVVIAIVIALMGFSAALATKEQPAAAPAEAPAAAAAYQDPSLVGLSITGGAEPDGNVPMYE